MRAISDTPPFEIQPSSTPTASVIWLHGLGADGRDFEDIVPMLRLDGLGIRFIFPNAPKKPVSINGSMIMRAWYDMRMTPAGIEQDAADIAESCASLDAMIAEETSRGIPNDRIVLAGFSQGGAIALHTGLRYAHALAGLLVLSAPVPYVDGLASEIHTANSRCPVFMAHGTHDSVVPYNYATANCQRLQDSGVRIDWHSYSMGHEVSIEEINDIGAWLRQRLS